MSCPQGEQCNTVPDTVDDIVADIGQEERGEGSCSCLLSHISSLHIFRLFGRFISLVLLLADSLMTRRIVTGEADEKKTQEMGSVEAHPPGF